MKKRKIAVLLPCYNEEKSVAKVVRDFKTFLPDAEVYVYDNNSTDGTVREAAGAGAVVRQESYQGKGNVVRRMFADIDADIYVMSDGDETYDIKRVPELIKRFDDKKLDMVIGSRREVDLAAYRVGHRWGNKMLTGLVQFFFRCNLTDMLSGFRVFSKRFVKSFPAQSPGFEIETELTVFALSARLPFEEVETDYFARPAGSVSKLSTVKDGLRILKMIILLVKEEKPLLFFNAIALFMFFLSLLLGVPLVLTYLESGLVPRLPTALLATGLMLCAVTSFLVGLILDSVSSGKREMRRMFYLHHKASGD